MSMFSFVDSSEPCPHCWDEGGAVRVPNTATLQKEDCAYCFCTPAHGTGLYICMACHESFCEDHLSKHMASNSTHSLYTKMSRLPPRLTDEDVVDAIVTKKKFLAGSAEVDEEGLKTSMMGEVSKDVNQLGVISEAPVYDYRVVCVDCNQVFLPAASSPDAVAEGLREGDLMFDFGLINAAFKAIVHAASVAVQGSESATTTDADDPYRNSIVCQHTNRLIQDIPSRYFDAATGVSTMPDDPATLKCQLCDCKSNNWLCMICGAVGCPRKEAGGNGHAMTHFEQTGHSVVLKLGTVTPKGADLYCYACDTEVKDPKLAEHLSFFGINMANATKTAKSLGEMAYDLTMQHDYKAICDVGEDGKSTLKPAFGGNATTGLHNFGNTCYMASVMQVLASTSPGFRTAFLDSNHVSTCTSKSPRDCFGCQLEKLMRALYSDRFSKPPGQQGDAYGADRHLSGKSTSSQANTIKAFNEAVVKEIESPATADRKPLCATLNPESRPRQAAIPLDIFNGVTPRDLKRVLANGRADFLSGDQQDAQEFMAHVLALARAKVHAGAPNRSVGGKSEREEVGPGAVTSSDGVPFSVDPTRSTCIEMVVRKECLACQRVAYARNIEEAVRLANPVDPSELPPAPLPGSNEPEPPRPKVTLNEVIERFVSPSVVEGARCEDCHAADGFLTTNRLANLPEVLILDVNRQYFDMTSLSTKKMNVLVTPPEEVDLAFLKGPNSPQPGEMTLSSHTSGLKLTSEVTFADAPAKPAAAAVAAAPKAVVAVDEMSLVQLISMGIEQPTAEWALRQTNNNVEAAVDMVFSGAAPSVDELLAAQQQSTTNTTQPNAAPSAAISVPIQTSDVSGNPASVRYRLEAIISHVGSSAQTGHYVCHIRKPQTLVISEAFAGGSADEDKYCWISFNDEKVGVSVKPPFEQASTYVYRRL